MAIYNILTGESKNYNAIWADTNASINFGKFYIATTGSGSSLSIVDLQQKTVVDSYAIDNIGINNEFLIDEDIIDINVSIVGI